jgi:drug/metabolite transporter (DMT)-like permease
MKEGLKVLTAYQVATLRMLSAGIILVPFAYKALKNVPSKQLGLVILSGFLGSFFPAYLFCIAETKIDSSLAGILNAFTPLFTILTGVLFFEMKILTAKKSLGIVIGFTGLLLLFTSNGHLDFKNVSYSALILLATLLYGLNLNLVGRKLHQVGSLNIATIAFVFLIIPCLVILYFSGYFSLPLGNAAILFSTAASAVLGIMGTAVSSVLFYLLIKRAGALFSSMISYAIPIVAVCWGFLLDEQITRMEIVSLGVILTGVYLVNTNNNPFSRSIKSKERIIESDL